MFDWLWPGKARTASIRQLLLQVSAENQAAGVKPAKRWALPDLGKVKMKNPRLSRFQEHEGKVVAFLRKRA